MHPIAPPWPVPSQNENLYLLDSFADIVPRPRKAPNEPPAGFTVNRSLGPGRYKLLEVFPGLDTLPAFIAVTEKDPGKLDAVLGTLVEVVKDDVWMYIAPRVQPKIHGRDQWHPVLSGDLDIVVVGHGHLTESSPILLYMDILHELCHVTQRHKGIELWDPKYEYVDRPTELEAYQFVIDEAKRLGATKPFLKEYLKVEWVSEEDYQRLLQKMGLSGD
jgi:hypothetical protein